ncbi:MAG: DUF6677 family protein [Phycisphaerae bacterium]
MAKAAEQRVGVESTQRSTPVAGFLAWLLPGLGHWYLGLRSRAIVIFVTLTVTFWGGVALGGVRSTMNVRENGPWVAAQLCAGAQSIAALMWAKATPGLPQYEAAYPSADIAVVYTGICGLLNLLVIVDALARSELGSPALARAEGGRAGPPERSS